MEHDSDRLWEDQVKRDGEYKVENLNVELQTRRISRLELDLHDRTEMTQQAVEQLQWGEDTASI